MSSHFRRCCRVASGCVVAVAALALIGAAPDDGAKPQAAKARRVLRVGADPNNLPFSNQRLEGMENKLAALVAREMDAELQYTWHAQRRGFFRKCLKENNADLVLSVPKGLEMALTTDAYYRSTYVFVSRSDRKLDIRSMDDPQLKRLKVGVHLVGDDGSNTPPAHALARRGIVDNVIGHTLYGDYREENPPARLIEAVVSGDVDVAIVWGPLAGFFAQRQSVPLEVVPVTPAVDPPAMRFQFNIAMGVRQGDEALRDEINKILVRRQTEINQILEEYRVPRVKTPEEQVPRAAALATDRDDHETDDH